MGKGRVVCFVEEEIQRVVLTPGNCADRQDACESGVIGIEWLVPLAHVRVIEPHLLGELVGCEQQGLQTVRNRFGVWLQKRQRVQKLLSPSDTSSDWRDRAFAELLLGRTEGTRTNVLRYCSVTGSVELS